MSTGPSASGISRLEFAAGMIGVYATMFVVSALSQPSMPDWMFIFVLLLIGANLLNYVIQMQREKARNQASLPQEKSDSSLGPAE